MAAKKSTKSRNRKGSATPRRRTSAASTSVRVKGRSLILRFSEQDLARALECLDSNREIVIDFDELRIRDFPTDMTFGRISHSASADGDSDSDSDSDSDLDADWDID